MRITRAAVPACILVVGLLHAVPAQAIVNGQPPSDHDWRFDAVGAFATTWRLGLDPTHPGAQDHDWYCAATLTSPKVVVLARHCVESYPPGEPFAVRFRRKPDGSLGTIEQGPKSFHHALIESWHFPASGDVAVGFLKEAVTHIQPIPIVFGGMDTLAPGTAFHHAGWGKEGPGPGEGPKRQLLLCDNTLTQVQPAGLWFYDAWNPAGPGCGVNNNDSGSPILLESPDGELRTIGVVTSYGFAVGLLQYELQRPFPKLARPFRSVDLAPAGLSVEAPSCVPPGSPISFTATTANVGGPWSVGPAVLFEDMVTLEATNGSVHPVRLAVTELSTGELPAVWMATVIIPEDTPEGSYRLVFTVDSGAVLPEAVETNNRLASQVLAVGPPGVRQCTPQP